MPGCLQSISALTLSGEYNTQVLQGEELWHVNAPHAEAGAQRIWVMRQPALGMAALQDLCKVIISSGNWRNTSKLLLTTD